MPSILGREVGAMGYGLMGHTLGPSSSSSSDELAFEALRAAADSGCVVWCGAEFYGPPTNNSLVLLEKFFTEYPEYVNKVLINIKGGLRQNWTPDGSPDYATKSAENCIAQLGGKARISTFTYARKDPKVPFETTLGALTSVVESGRIDGIGLSEVNANSIREAAQVCKIAAVEVELSLWCTGPLSNGISSACAELNIPILAYCPLGRAMLTGKLQSPEEIPDGDFRKELPRYKGENFQANLKLVRDVEGLAKKKGCTAAQVALGWLLAISRKPGMPVIIPIPGSTSIEHIRENAKIVELTEEEMNEIESILALHPVQGDRYHSWGMLMTDM